MGYQEAWADHEHPHIDAVTCEEMVDATDRARGYGAAVAEVLAAPPRRKRSPELLAAFLRSMPEELRTDLGKKTAAELDERAAAMAIYHASLGMTYGVTAESVVELGYDAAKTAFCAAQSICLALGYEELARSLVETVTPEISFTRGEKDDLLLFAPYSAQLTEFARNRRDIIHRTFKQDGKWYRAFKPKFLPNIINVLTSIWLDAFVLGPDGNLSVLPSKQALEVPFPIEPLPRDERIRATGEKAPLPILRIGEFVNYKGKDFVVVDAAPQFPQRVGFRALEKREGEADFFTTIHDLAKVKTINAREANLRLQAIRLEEAKLLGEQGPPLLSEEDGEKLARLSLPVDAFAHQIDGIKFLWLNGRALLADEPGLGKTLQSLAAAEFPCLVVCPSKLKMNWVREVGRWRPGSTVSVISGGDKPSEEARGADVVVINYDILTRHVDWLMTQRWKTIIADEATALKNIEYKTVQLNEYDAEGNRKVAFDVAAGSPALAAAFYQVQLANPESRLYLLTGTPLMNRTKELFPLMNMIDRRNNPFEVAIDDGWRGVKKYYPWQDYRYFCARYCHEHGGRRRKRRGHENAISCQGRSNSIELNSLLTSRFMLRRTKDILKLPPLSRQIKHITLSASGARNYRQAAVDLVAYLRAIKGTEAALKAGLGGALVLLGTLRRLAAMGKVDALLDEIVRFRNGTGRPLLVMAVHKEVIASIKKGLDELNNAVGAGGDLDAKIRYGVINGDTAAKDADKMVRGFQGLDARWEKTEPTYDVIIMSIKVATGMTLTRASDMFFIEREWRPADLVQAEGRMDRLGQVNNMTATYLDAPGTIDEFMANLLLAKAIAAAAVVDGEELDDEEAQRRVLGVLLGVDADDPEDLAHGLAEMLSKQLLSANSSFASRELDRLPFTVAPTFD
jgi:hypothetical protein